MGKFFFNAKNMTVGYHEKAIVENINIQLNKGEILTIIGPNGGGKSTILKSIARHMKLLGGTVLLNKKDMSKLSGNEIAKTLSIVLTQHPHTERLSCEDVISIGRYPYTGKFGFLSAEDKEKVQEAMKLVHVFELRNKDFNEISDGQKQRVLLACAVCQEPEIILLDEPTTFLDIKYKLELLSILKVMAHKKQITIIMSLHELDLAQKISDFVLCVKDGYIEKQGTPAEIFTTSYIRQLYHITEGSYNDTFGCAEMKPQTGQPEVFVIAGGGSGIPIFRLLQRKGIPFAVGVLHENDIDFELAKMIANEVIAEKSFEPIGDESFEKAKKVLSGCKKVVCCLKQFGTMNHRNSELLKYAKSINLSVLPLEEFFEN